MFQIGDVVLVQDNTIFEGSTGIVRSIDASGRLWVELSDGSTYDFDTSELQPDAGRSVSDYFRFRPDTSA